MRSVKMLAPWMMAIALFALLGTGCNEPSPEDTKKKIEQTSKTTAEVKKATDKAAPGTPEKKDAAVVPDTLYPELPLGLLNPKERKTLVDVTSAELCPCPGATSSLHECLQQADKRCALAMHAGAAAMKGIKEGKSQKDVLESVGAYIQAAHKKYEFNLKDIPHKGNVDAPVVLVEFADFECPFCNQARVIVKEAMKGNEDNVVFYYKHFPLSFHPNAFLASCATVAAGKQGRFWEMYELLFDNQRILSEPKIEYLAQELGLNMDKFRKDWKDPEVAKFVEAQRDEGGKSNVDSTPTFFINGRKYLGEKTPEALKQALEDELSKAKAKK